MKWLLNVELSKKCEEFVKAYWGRDGVSHVRERPVTWVRHEANPHLKQLRRKQKQLPLLTVKSAPGKFRVQLSTERRETWT